MSKYQTDQRRITYRGRQFHFVSYEGQIKKLGEERTEEPPTWFLMAAGKRWPVMTQVAGQDEAEVGRLLLQWLDDHMETALPEPAPVPAVRRFGRRR